MDRNAKAKQKAQAEFAQAQMRKQFLSQLASGETGTYDKERTKLEAGHLVVWNQPPEIFYWLVKDVSPALDLPQPAIRVTLTITVPLVLQPGVRMGNMLVVGKQGEQDPGVLARDSIEGDNAATEERRSIQHEDQGDTEPATTGEPPADESSPRGTPEEPADGAAGTDKPKPTIN